MTSKKVERWHNHLLAIGLQCVFFNDFRNETWDIGCTLISNLDMSVNPIQRWEIELQYEHKLWSEAFGLMKLFTFNNTFWPTTTSTSFFRHWLTFFRVLGISPITTWSSARLPHVSWAKPHHIGWTVVLNVTFESWDSRLEHMHSISHFERQPFSRQMCGYIATKFRLTHVVRPISLVCTHLQPQILVLYFIYTLHLSICLGVEGHA